MFHRSYDIAFVLDVHERTSIQNAINGVNAACSESVDAWLYVSQGLLMADISRTLGDHDYIPKTIFAAMSKNHNMSFHTTVQALQSIAQDYEGWRNTIQQANSRTEDTLNFWNTWKNIKLMPYYMSVSGGGSRVSIGPILENFLSIKYSRNDLYSDELSKIEQELMSHLGQNLEERINVLTQIIAIEKSPYCSSLLMSLKKRQGQQASMEHHNDILVKEAITQLSAAIESRNPIALKAALYPAWYSVKFHSSELYKNGLELLSQIS